MAEEKTKHGMYGETPRIQIGKLTVCMYTDRPNEQRIYIENEDGEGGTFNAIDFEKVIKDKFNELF